MKKTMAILAILFLCSCSDGIESSSTEAKGKVTVDEIEIECVGQFDDSRAYGGKRKVFRIRDTKTGAEFIGVTGVGISEVGTHKSGKTTIKEER